MTLAIEAPRGAAELDLVRDLMRAFVSWHRSRHQQDLELIERYFDPGEFEAELAGLPGKYASPDGQLLLATIDGRAAGCVALRRIDEETCEMKRMFVSQDLHGMGVGRALALAIMDEARLLGYLSMVLDTSVRQIEAQSLYRKLGFAEADPYYEMPDDLRAWLVFMRRAL